MKLLVRGAALTSLFAVGFTLLYLKCDADLRPRGNRSEAYIEFVSESWIMEVLTLGSLGIGVLWSLYLLGRGIARLIRWLITPRDGHTRPRE